MKSKKVSDNTMNDIKRSVQAISAFIFLSKYCETEKCEKCVFNTGGVGTKQEYGCGLVAALSDHRRFSTVLERAINRGSIMKCDRCNGQGFSVIAKWKCPVCDGTGKVVHPMMSMNGDEYTGEWEQHECEACNGTGEIEQTNEEWLKSLDTECLVDHLYEVHKGGASVERQAWIEKHKERIKMQIRGWLKEKHDG